MSYNKDHIELVTLKGSSSPCVDLAFQDISASRWHMKLQLPFHLPKSMAASYVKGQRRKSSREKQGPTFNSAAVVWGFCPDRPTGEKAL